MERILRLDLSIQSLERMVADDACDVAAFYDHRPTNESPTPLGAILVAQADGKGVPMVQPPVTSIPVRLGKGQKRTKKKRGDRKVDPLSRTVFLWFSVPDASSHPSNC